MDIVLASQSPIRSMLLKNAGVFHRCVPSNIDERTIKKKHVSFGGRDLSLCLAEAKARHVGEKYPESYVIGSDQVLVFGDEIFDKPLDRDTTRRHLQNLQGKTHALISAAAVCHRGDILWTHAQTVRLSMRKLSDSDIERYLDEAGEDVYHSVGGYHFEGLGVRLFTDIEGDYFTILGLPLLAVLSFLRIHECIDF